MENSSCLQCQKKAQLQCGCCHQPVCKNCAEFIDESVMSYWPDRPEALKQLVYCSYCFQSQVLPEIEKYDEWMKSAQDVFVFFKDQGKETRLIKRKEKAFRVEGSTDKQETLMKLAFLAVKAGYNALVDVELASTKVRVGGYQTLNWTGTGIPVQVDAAKENKKISQI